MAFNFQVFKTRALTAIVFAVVMLAGLLWNHWSFFVLFSIIHFGCWWEYLKLTEKIHNTAFHIYTKLGLMLMGYGFMLGICHPLFQIGAYSLKDSIALPVSGAGFAILVMGIFQKDQVKLKAFGMALTGLIYISFSWGLMLDIYGFAMDSIHGHQVYPYAVPVTFEESQRYMPWLLPVVIIVSIWINDTMAYIVGSLIGRTPLTKISPKKTWEGTIGGIILTVGIAFLIPLLFDKIEVEPVVALIVAAVTAISGTFGDLFESKLKRMAGVKDSGSLLPGHGGFLDRFDSLLFAIPVAWIVLKPCLFGPC